MSSLARRRANDYPRACDDCGHEWLFKQLKYIGLNRWVCPDDKRLLTREQYARHMSRPIPTIFGPRKHPKTSGSIGTYQTQEADHLNICATKAATAYRVGQSGETIQTITTSILGVVESLRYLGTMVVDGNRPEKWLELARSAVVTLADLVLANQYGSLTGPDPTLATNYFHYGSITVTGFPIYTIDTVIGGIGLLRAYAITGQQKYLDGALRVGFYVRNNQRCDRGATVFTTTSSGGSTRLFLGGWPDGPNGVNTFSMSGAAALWFLKELKTTLGGSTLIGATAAGNDLAQATSATIDTSISEGLAFYTTTSYGSAAPLSSTTPKSYLSAFQNLFSGDGAWHLEGSPERFITSRSFAYGLRGVYEASGYSAVSSVYSWLLGFSSDTDFHAGDQSHLYLRNTLLGTYDPTFAIATTLQVKNDAGTAAASQNGSSTYDLGATALLAPITIASGRTLRSVKDELVRDKERVSGAQGRHEALSLGPIGSMGLGFQVPSTINIDLDTCAVVGELYRYAPQSWSGQL